MSNQPVLIAYAVRERPGKKSIWTRIGAAWPHDKGAGLTVILNLMPIEPRIVLVEPNYDLPPRPPHPVGLEQAPPDPAPPLNRPREK